MRGGASGDAYPLSAGIHSHSCPCRQLTLINASLGSGAPGDAYGSSENYYRTRKRSGPPANHRRRRKPVRRLFGHRPRHHGHRPRDHRRHSRRTPGRFAGAPDNRAAPRPTGLEVGTQPTCNLKRVVFQHPNSFLRNFFQREHLDQEPQYFQWGSDTVNSVNPYCQLAACPMSLPPVGQGGAAGSF